MAVTGTYALIVELAAPAVFPDSAHPTVAALRISLRCSASPRSEHFGDT